MSFVLEAVVIAARALPQVAALLVLVALAALAAYGLGARLLGAGEPGREAGLAIALGVTLLGTTLFALGLAGLLTRPAVWGLWGAAVAAGWPVWRRLARSWRGWSTGGRVAAVLLGLAIVAFASALLAYPVTGFDPMTYRLVTARAFGASGGLPFLPDLRFPIGAQFSEVLFAAALLVADDRLTRGLELLAALAAAGVVYGWAARRGSPRAGLLAVALWVGSPFVVLYATDAYVDVGTALFATAALAAVDRFRQEGGGRWAAIAKAQIGRAHV